MACVGNASGNTVPFLLTVTFLWLPLEVGAGNFTCVYMTEYYIVREILAQTENMHYFFLIVF